MCVKKVLKLSFIFLILLNSRNVFAVVSKIETYDPTIEENLVRTDEIISNWFNGVTEGIDLFLVGKKIVKKPQSSSEIILGNTSYSREGDNFTNLTSISINPRFPNLEAYWNLKFSTYDDTTIGNTSAGGYARQKPKDKKYAASVGLFRKLKDVRVAFQPRIELQDPLKISHFLSAETVVDNGSFKLNPKFQLFADATVGTGSFQAFNINIPLTEVFSITLLNEGEYEEKLHSYSVTNGFSLGQILTDSTALAYGLSFYSNNQPNYHLDAYSLSVTWSEVIYKKLLDYNVTPHFDFVKNEGFRGFVGLVIAFNLRF